MVTNAYSTSFSMATKMLSDNIRQDIYNIYGFVRFADEIVDTFHDYDKEKDDTRRMEMIIEECNRLSKMENEIINFYKNNKQRFLDNRQKLYEISKKDELSFLEYIL